MRKVIVAMFAVMLVILLTLGACAKPAPAPTPAPAPAPTPAPAPAPTPAQPPRSIEWKSQHVAPSGSLQYQSMQRLSDSVKKASAGRLIINALASGGVMPAGKEFEGVDQNALQINWSSAAFLVGKYDRADIFHVVVDGMSPVETIIWYNVGGALDRFNAMIKDTNVQVISPFPLGPEIFLSLTKPLNNPADFKGLKLRVAGAMVEGVAFTRMGASAVVVPGGELYEAVKRGVIDGYQYGSPSMDLAVSFYEIIKYMYLSPVRQPNDTQIFIVNKKAWSDLTDDLKAIVIAEIQKEGWNFYFNQIVSDNTAIEKFKSYGVNVSPLPKSIEDEFRRIVNEIYAEKSAASPAYKELLDNYSSFKAAIRANFPRL